ncbi:hypothetical protein D1007_12124 [Hordeum vulgare]|nr:hypothetical protein D1007_12124 [Hordeum vulgare]
MAMVVSEFICRRIAPLQRHSRSMWAYTGPSYSMRNLVIPFSPHVLRELLPRLTGGNPDELPPIGMPLYNFKPPGALAMEMPLFDEWGLLPEGERRSPAVAPPRGRPPKDTGCVVTP